MLATLSDRAPAGGGWIYEPKLDGVRVLAYVTGGSVRLFSRNRKQVEGGYPELVEQLSLAVRGEAVLDGEITAPDPATGLSSFARLQQRMHLRDVQRAARTGVSVELYLFDCLFYEGIDLTGLPLLDRKKVLRDVVWYDGAIRFTPYRTTGSAAMYRDACAKGAEGILAKRAESRYVSGRSADWLKIKCVQQQEFVIGGYTEPQGTREHLGALLVGYHDGDGKLRYAGKVGTGFDRDALEMLYRKLVPLHRRTSPFAPGPVPGGAVQWVTPNLVAQIGFGEWTGAGLLRHPRFLGLRDDKAARDVRREG
ncbi:MAG: ATP-dependent DNA ligase [Gemmatimonadales bacterium]|nr:ATP-dependent DNA ligase [Gemmatimonadales bacterium]